MHSKPHQKKKDQFFLKKMGTVTSLLNNQLQMSHVT